MGRSKPDDLPKSQIAHDLCSACMVRSYSCRHLARFSLQNSCRNFLRSLRAVFIPCMTLHMRMQWLLVCVLSPEPPHCDDLHLVIASTCHTSDKQRSSCRLLLQRL